MASERSPLPFADALVARIGLDAFARSERGIASGYESGADESLVVFGRLAWSDDALASLGALRALPAQAPVLVVAGPCEARARIDALTAGADDFVSIPFDVGELVARARGLIRRTSRFAYGPLRLDVVRRLAWLDGRRLDLTAREFDIVLTLMRHAGEVAPLAEHLAEGGRAARPRSNVLNVYVNSIRRKLGRHARLLRTVRGVGFKLRVPDE